MKKSRLMLVPALLVALAVVAAGCGGGGGAGSVPANAVAEVGSVPVTKAQFDGLMRVAAAGYKAKGQAAPKVGTTAYSTLKTQAVTFLVQQNQLQQEAQKLGVTVTQKDIDARVALIKKQYGTKKFNQTLSKDQISLSDLEKYNLLPALLSEKLYAKVTSKSVVSATDAKRYYEQNKASFTTPAQTTRSVRHILVSSKSLANQLEQKLKHGANFADLAKRYSKDTGSAKSGGKLTAVKGQLVKPFQDVAFSLRTNQISQPVHSQFGWHIIQALGPVKHTPAHVQSFSQAEAQIQSNLASQNKQQVWQTWLNLLPKKYQGKVAYQTGYAPATTSTTAGAPGTTTG